MSVIVKTSYEEASQYKGKGVSVKIGSKTHNVYFKVVIDDCNISDALNNNDSNIIMYEYQGLSTNPIYLSLNTSNLYITKSYEFGADINESDIVQVISETPEGVTPIIKIPQDYKDFEFVCRMCDKYERIRFCGGIMFCAEGCRIGCCGRDVLEDMEIKHGDTNYIKEGCGCALNVISGEGLDLIISDKKAKSERKKSTGGTKKQKTKMFSDLFGGFSMEL